MWNHQHSEDVLAHRLNESILRHENDFMREGQRREKPESVEKMVAMRITELEAHISKKLGADLLHAIQHQTQLIQMLLHDRGLANTPVMGMPNPMRMSSMGMRASRVGSPYRASRGGAGAAPRSPDSPEGSWHGSWGRNSPTPNVRPPAYGSRASGRVSPLESEGARGRGNSDDLAEPSEAATNRNQMLFSALGPRNSDHPRLRARVAGAQEEEDDDEDAPYAEITVYIVSRRGGLMAAGTFRAGTAHEARVRAVVCAEPGWFAGGGTSADERGAGACAGAWSNVECGVVLASCHTVGTLRRGRASDRP
jgi:hypothetical protein